MANKREVRKSINLAIDTTQERIDELQDRIRTQQIVMDELKRMNSRLLLPGRFDQGELQEMEMRAEELEEGELERTF